MAARPPVDLDDLTAHAAWLNRLARRLVAGAGAEDAVQDTWMALLEKPPRGEGPLRPWLARVLINFGRRRRRDEARLADRHHRFGTGESETLPGAEELLARHQVQRMVAALVADLEEPFRSTLLLCYFEGLAPSDVARRHGIPPGTVRWRLKRGLDLLRARLDERHGGDRRTWVLLVAPLARKAAPAATAAAVVKGAFVMKKVVALTGLLALLLAAGLWTIQQRALTGSSTRPDDHAGHGRGAARLAGSPWDQPARGTTSVEGTVRGLDGTAVAGATVALTRAREGEPDRLGNGAPLLTYSDGEGRFRFTAVIPGRHAASATAEGHGSVSRPLLTVVQGATTTLDLVLGGAALTLSGRVLDAGGGPIPGASVWAREWPPTATEDAPVVFQTRARDDGAYRMGLAVGRYLLVAEVAGYAPYRTAVYVSRDHGKDLRLAPAARLEGRVVVRGGGAPVENAEVWLISDHGGEVTARDVLTDGEGAFAFLDVEAGRYQIRARKGLLTGVGTPIAVAVAEVATGLMVELAPGAVVIGQVRGLEGRLLHGARVEARTAAPPWDRPAVVRTDQQGRYRMEGLAAGRHRLMASADGHAPTRQVMDLNSGVREQDFQLTAAARVQGAVLRADGTPAAGARLGLMLIERGSNQQGEGARRQITADAGGRFAFEGLAGGQLQLVAEHPDGAAELAPAALGAGETREVTLRLAPAGAIAGTVRFDDGTPAAGVPVTAHHRSSRASFATSDTTDRHGRYRLAPFVAGQVVISASRRGERAMGMVDHAHQRNLSLGPAEQRTDVDLVIPHEDQRLRGRVLDAEGRPVGGATVYAVREATGERGYGHSWTGDRAVSAADGTFQLEDLPRGAHRLWASHPDHPEAQGEGQPGGAPVTLRFSAGGILDGTVLDERGAAVTDFSVALVAAPGRGSYLPLPRQEVRDAGGAFRFEGLGAGRYELSVATLDGKVGRAEVTVEARAKRNVRVAVGPGAKLTGRVVEYLTSRALPGVEVSVGVASGGSRSTTSEGDGSFTLDGIVPGRITLSLSADPRTHVSDSRFLDVPAGRDRFDVGTVPLVPGDFESKYTALERAGRGSIGIGYQNMNGQAVIISAETYMPGARAGVRLGDLVLAIDGKDMRNLGYRGIYWHVIRPADTAITLVLQAPGEAPRTITTKMLLRHAKPR